MADRTFLQLRGLTYWYIRDVPKKLREWTPSPQTGKAHFRVNLRTSDLYAAQRMRSQHSARFDHLIRIAEERLKAGAVDALVGEAQGYQAFIAKDDTEYGNTHRLIVEELLENRVIDVERRYGANAASKFWSSATGNFGGVAVDQHLDQFNAELGGKAHSQYKRQKAIRELAAWRSSLYLHSFDAKLCREFVDQKLVPGRKVGTINSYLGVLSQYWQWLMDKGYLKEGPTYWSKHRRKKQRKKIEEKERAFTDQEMRTLFCGNIRMDGALLDASIAGALSGARQKEIGDLKVADLDFRGRLIHLPGEKTEAADRTIPLHPHLVPMFKRRCKNKNPSDFVFHELPSREASALKPRSSVISQGFTRYRRKVGVGFGPERNDRSPVNFHSFRRWFAKQLKEKGAPSEIVDKVCGWERGTMGELYAWDAKLQEQARPFIEQVMLPECVLANSVVA